MKLTVLNPKTTRIVLLVALTLLLVYEFMTLAWGTNATISETVWTLTYHTPLVPLLTGVLIGHFFFPKGVCVHCGKRPWAKDDEAA